MFSKLMQKDRRAGEVIRIGFSLEYKIVRLEL
jgi:hypothetical protein